METELDAINKRNIRVEADKAWETSNTRRLIIAIFTYLIVVIFLMLSSIFINKTITPSNVIVFIVYVLFIIPTASYIYCADQHMGVFYYTFISFFIINILRRVPISYKGRSVSSRKLIKFLNISCLRKST